jgi:hypothetical protein
VRAFAIAVVISVAATACSRSQPTGAANGASEPANRVVDAGSGAKAAAAPADDKSGPVSSEADREITIPEGTPIPIVLDTAIGSDTSRVEDPISAHVSQEIRISGVSAIPEGSTITGVVTDAQRPGKVKGRAHIAVRFDWLSPRGENERYRIRTALVGRTAPGTKTDDALKIGIPAAGGAIIGGLIGGKKGALIGAAAGGGGGAAVVLSTRGKDVRLGRGATMSLRLTEPLTVRVIGTRDQR